MGWKSHISNDMSIVFLMKTFQIQIFSYLSCIGADGLKRNSVRDSILSVSKSFYFEEILFCRWVSIKRLISLIFHLTIRMNSQTWWQMCRNKYVCSFLIPIGIRSLSEWNFDKIDYFGRFCTNYYKYFILNFISFRHIIIYCQLLLNNELFNPMKWITMMNRRNIIFRTFVYNNTIWNSF